MMVKRKQTIRQPMFYEEPEQAGCHILEELSVYENCRFADGICEVSCDHSTVRECEFDRVVFASSFRDGQFSDVIFDHCDFSNTTLAESGFRRCIFHNCRMIGTEWINCSYEDVIIENAQADYANFNETKWKNALWKESSFCEGSFAMMQMKNLQFERCRFEASEWLETKLAGLDFSDSQIDGMRIRPQDLSGVMMNADQALECAKLLGIVIR